MNEEKLREEISDLLFSITTKKGSHLFTPELASDTTDEIIKTIKANPVEPLVIKAVSSGVLLAEMPGELFIPKEILLKFLKTSHLKKEVDKLKEGYWAKLYLDKTKDTGYRIGYTSRYSYHYLYGYGVTFEEAVKKLHKQLLEFELINSKQSL